MLGLLGLEVWLRWRYGLGNPPLYVRDAELEYVMKPNQRCRRRGRLIAINGLGMRCDDWPEQRAEVGEAGERRVLVMGDSVVFGGNAVDQSELATSRLEHSLSVALGGRVRVGNVGVASWGPGNLHAFSQRHGFLGADAVVVVMSSHDAVDVPSDNPYLGNLDRPTQRPWCALSEAWQYWKAGRVRGGVKNTTGFVGAGDVPGAKRALDPGLVASATASLEALLRSAGEGGRPVALALHLERGELGDRTAMEPGEGYGHLRGVGESLGVPILELGPAFAEAEAAGDRPYRDAIHPSASGQGVMAGVLERWLVGVLTAESVTGNR
ncbi:MAG: hypothetical protein AAF750_14055 [Planctomycetota bacterium]